MIVNAKEFTMLIMVNFKDLSQEERNQMALVLNKTFRIYAKNHGLNLVFLKE